MTSAARRLALELLLDGAYLTLSSSAIDLREVSGGGYVACSPDLTEWAWDGAKATLTHAWKLNPGLPDIPAWFLVRDRDGKPVVLLMGRLKDEDGKERACRVVVRETPVEVSVTVEA